MNILKITFLGLLVTTFVTSCGRGDDGGTHVPTQNTVSETVTIGGVATYGSQISGDFVKFDFSEKSTTTSDQDWDIAIRGTAILVNGGEVIGLSSNEPARTGNAAAYVFNGIFNEVTSVDTSLLKQDSTNGGLAIPTGSGNGWYIYDGLNHVISPAAGKILVFRTADGKYAKMEITKYDTEINTSATIDNYQYTYTFNYAYQPNDSTNF